MGEEAEAASLMGFWDTLAKKLPTMRGVISYFYVAANWSRISEEQEALRRQIKPVNCGRS